MRTLVGHIGAQTRGHSIKAIPDPPFLIMSILRRSRACCLSSKGAVPWGRLAGRLSPLASGASLTLYPPGAMTRKSPLMQQDGLSLRHIEPVTYFSVRLVILASMLGSNLRRGSSLMDRRTGASFAVMSAQKAIYQRSLW